MKQKLRFGILGGFISLTHLNDLKIEEYQNFPGHRLSRAMQDFSEVRGNNIWGVGSCKGHAAAMTLRVLGPLKRTLQLKKDNTLRNFRLL